MDDAYAALVSDVVGALAVRGPCGGRKDVHGVVEGVKLGRAEGRGPLVELSAPTMAAVDDTISLLEGGRGADLRATSPASSEERVNERRTSKLEFAARFFQTNLTSLPRKREGV